MLDIKKLPWKSNMFSWGIVAIVISMVGILWHLNPNIVSINELKVYEGTLLKLEKWQVKNRVGIDLYILNVNDTKRFNSTSCKNTLDKISIGDQIVVYVEDASSISRVIGSIWQIENNSEIICDYESVAARKERSNNINLILAGIVFSLGVLFSTIGYRLSKSKVT